MNQYMKQYGAIGDGNTVNTCKIQEAIEECSITGTDDNLCLQSSSKEYPVENIHISNCEFTSLCAAVRIGLKSIGDIHDVVITNCTMRNVWREGIKIECTEGGSITDIQVNQISMRNVSRPIFVILNNRFLPDDLGSSKELTEMPEIGKMEHIVFSNMTAIDEEEMEQIHYRFGDDIMGSPCFNGIRIDAEEQHPIDGITISNLSYRCLGGVKREEILSIYPKVIDRKKDENSITSENYYPDWSRTTYMDIRNVKKLYLSNLQFESINVDEREAFLIEGCDVIKKEILIG